jgi:hypothetical protein
VYVNIGGAGGRVECMKVWRGGGFRHRLLPVEGRKATVCTGVCPQGSLAGEVTGRRVLLSRRVLIYDLEEAWQVTVHA